jgi:hypothetical protein
MLSHIAVKTSKLAWHKSVGICLCVCVCVFCIVLCLNLYIYFAHTKAHFKLLAADVRYTCTQCVAQNAICQVWMTAI